MDRASQSVAESIVLIAQRNRRLKILSSNSFTPEDRATLEALLDSREAIVTSIPTVDEALGLSAEEGLQYLTMLVREHEALANLVRQNELDDEMIESIDREVEQHQTIDRQAYLDYGRRKKSDLSFLEAAILGLGVGLIAVAIAASQLKK